MQQRSVALAYRHSIFLHISSHLSISTDAMSIYMSLIWLVTMPTDTRMPCGLDRPQGLLSQDQALRGTSYSSISCLPWCAVAVLSAMLQVPSH
jgi:hypothetical protein